jgi:hypothetical protein
MMLSRFGPLKARESLSEDSGPSSSKLLNGVWKLKFVLCNYRTLILALFLLLKSILSNLIGLFFVFGLGEFMLIDETHFICLTFSYIKSI